MIYLDNGATTKPHEAVLSTYTQVSKRFFANPSSIHELGGEVASLQAQARKQVADLLQTHPDEIVFTSGGTEGNNLAIKGIALQHKGRGNHIITTVTEHASVYNAAQALEQVGFRVTYLPVDEYGTVAVEDVKRAVTDETILVSIMHVNNEIGTIQPIEEIASLLKEYPKLFFHVDAVQSLGKLSLDLRHEGIDLCTFSGHKIHGLKGTGVLYVKKGTSLFPLFHGGVQESGFRAGTENVAGNVSFARALRLIMEEENTKQAELMALREKMIAGLGALDKVVINCPENGAPHIVHLSVLGAKPEVVIHALYEKGIVISTQSACSSRQLTESRVLRACGHGEERAKTGLRITLSYETTEQDVMMLLQAMQHTLTELEKVWE